MNAGESPRNQGLSVKGAPVRFRRRSRGLRKNAAVERREVNALRTGVRRKALNRYRAFRRSAPLTLREGALPSSARGWKCPALPAPCENRGGGALSFFAHRLLEI